MCACLTMAEEKNIYHPILGTGEEMDFDIRYCDFHLSAVVKKRYLVNTEEDQSPEDWIISTDPPHWWRYVAPPLLKLWPLYWAAGYPVLVKRVFRRVVKEL